MHLKHNITMKFIKNNLLLTMTILFMVNSVKTQISNLVDSFLKNIPPQINLNTANTDELGQIISNSIGNTGVTIFPLEEEEEEMESTLRKMNTTIAEMVKEMESMKSTNLTNSTKEQMTLLGHQMNAVLSQYNGLQAEMNRMSDLRNSINQGILTQNSQMATFNNMMETRFPSQPVSTGVGGGVTSSYTSYTDVNGEEVFAFGSLPKTQDVQQNYGGFETDLGGGGGGGAGGAAAAGTGTGGMQNNSVYVMLIPVIIITCFLGIIVIHLGDPRLWPSIVRTITSVFVQILSVLPSNGGIITVNTNPEGDINGITLGGVDVFGTQLTQRIVSNTNNDLPNQARAIDHGFIPWHLFDGLQDLILSAIEEDECFDRVLCDTGKYIDLSDETKSIIGKLIPERLHEYTNIFLKSSTDLNSCEFNYKCNGIDRRKKANLYNKKCIDSNCG